MVRGARALGFFPLLLLAGCVGHVGLTLSGLPTELAPGEKAKGDVQVGFSDASRPWTGKVTIEIRTPDDIIADPPMKTLLLNASGRATMETELKVKHDAAKGTRDIKIVATHQDGAINYFVHRLTIK